MLQNFSKQFMCARRGKRLKIAAVQVRCKESPLAAVRRMAANRARRSLGQTELANLVVADKMERGVWTQGI